jgi:putative inorganic carbon (HCO3(-)) transporter
MALMQGGRVYTPLVGVAESEARPALAGPLRRRFESLRGPVAGLAVAGVLAAMLVGVALAASMPLGIALLLAILYVPLVLLSLPLGVVLWVPLVFLQGIPAANLAGKAAGLLIVGAWLGEIASNRDRVTAAARRHLRLLGVIAAVLVWFSISLAWTENTSAALADLWHWYALALLFVIVITVVTTLRAVTWMIAAFVGGAVISVCLGIADGSLTSAAEGAARLEGAAGDPNFLAASLVAAGVLAGTLLVLAKSPISKALLMVALGVLIVGLVTSASRGGALAGGVALVAAFVLFKRRRVQVAAIMAVVLAIAGLTFVNAPAAWDRVTNFNNDNGRSDLWTVGWRMGKDHPILGVGLNNFREQSANYVRQPGTLEHVQLIVDRPSFAHNTYLQLFAEEGIVGLALFLALVGASLHSAYSAAERFERRGQRDLSTLARAVLVATISMLAAGMFLSSALDQRLWLLLALGPALLTLAEAGARAPDGPTGVGGR